jgi:hypothetical protein
MKLTPKKLLFWNVSVAEKLQTQGTQVHLLWTKAHIDYTFDTLPKTVDTNTRLQLLRTVLQTMIELKSKGKYYIFTVKNIGVVR